MAKRLVLIDGHAILHRAFHAFPTSLTTRKGEMVNAVYGFIRMLLKVIADLHPEYLAVAFDLPQPTFRQEIFVGYQAQRPKTDSQLVDQIERVYEVVKALNIPIFTAPGFEADDVIASIARQTKGKLETVIVTGDRDIMQLVDKKVKVYAPLRGFAEGQLLGIKEVKRLLGVEPRQIVDYKALVGDASDNYPGVPGIGPKTAVTLLHQYQNLKKIYQNLKRFKPLLVQKLTQGKESAELSQRLATIVFDAPVKLNLKACRVKDYEQQKVIDLFEELEFKSLINKLPGAEPAKIKKPESEQMSLIQA